MLPEQDLVTIASEYTQLKKVGNEYVGLCPFHEETKPSFYIDPVSQLFYCFGCQTGGNLQTFLQKLGLPTKEEDIGTRALKFYKYVFKKHPPKFLDRELFTDEVCNEFNFGYSNGQLSVYLERKGFNQTQIYKLGLFKETDGRLEEIMSGRVIMPVILKGKVVSFVGYNPFKTPKYLFSKGKKYLFGLEQARRFSKESIYIVEGIRDFFACYNTGFKNVVATLGNKITYSNAVDIFRITNKVILVFDGDEAGKYGVFQFLENIPEFPVEISGVILPPDTDPYMLYEADKNYFADLLRKPLV